MARKRRRRYRRNPVIPTWIWVVGGAMAAYVIIKGMTGAAEAAAQPMLKRPQPE